MELVLIRHGRIAGNPYRPRDDDRLNELGRRQSALTAERLASEPPFDWLVSSDLARAQQTGEVIAARLGMPLAVRPALREMDRREMTRVVLAETTDRLAGRLALVRRAAARLREPVLARVRAFLAEAQAVHGAGRVLAVAHGGFIWATLAYCLPDQRREFVRHRQVANCSLTRIVLAPEGARLLAFDDIAHLGVVATR